MQLNAFYRLASKSVTSSSSSSTTTTTTKSQIIEGEARISTTKTYQRGCLLSLCLPLIVSLFCLLTKMGVDYCYSDIGCFPLSDEFYHPRHRPFNVRPWHRRHIRTQFELFNEKYPDGHLLKAWNGLNLISSGFNPKLETKIIIPGWLDNIDRVVWLKQMRDALLWLWQPVNIIVVRWRNFTPYTIATANTRVVGAELANLIKFIEHQLGYDRSYYHLIGHSLGAHIAGYCGDRIHGLGRITALDPARPFFQGMPKSVRLDRGDAKFIDAIHSDFTPENAIFLLMSFGMTTPVGHVDFYPNGPPLLQPGCLRDTLGAIQRGIIRGLQYSSLSVSFLEAIRYLTACDHQRSHEWFVESLINRECVFVGVRCNEYEGMINGRCTCDDSPSACAIMGIHADQMYLNNVHEDLWPVKAGRPGQQHLVHYQQQQQQQQHPVDRPKEELHSQLKLEAHKIRHSAQEPQALLGIDLEHLYGYHPSMAAMADDDNDYFMEAADLEPRLKSLEDLAFVEYLRTTLLLDHPLMPLQLAAPSVPMADQIMAPVQLPVPVTPNPDQIALNEVLLDRRRRADSQQDDAGGGEDRANQPARMHRRQEAAGGGQQMMTAGHPDLLSDLDRNIENWYEENSRWYLKTNNRPNYCSNQYQLLVFMGPLRARNGRDQLRANLLVSIVGSRGQLLRQRFVPRSASLDSFTMQPFFILLEGSYSLGQIQSVAIAWEARNEPHPLQATISFQNNRLAALQAQLPALKAKHPWLSETAKYDHSHAFQWRQPDLLANQYYRRSDDDHHHHHHHHQTAPIRRSGLAAAGSDRCTASKIGRTTRRRRPARRLQRRSSAAAADDTLTDYVDDDYVDDGVADYDGRPVAGDMLAAATGDRPTPQALVRIPPARDMEQKESSFLEAIVDPTGRLVDPKKAQASDGHLSVDFHNIDLNYDHGHEDSVVVSQVIVSPMEANYGRAGRNARVFCPPRANRRLARDQTLRLTASLASRCHTGHLVGPVH